MSQSAATPVPSYGLLRVAIILTGLLGGLAAGLLVEFEESFPDPVGAALFVGVFIFTTAFVLAAAPGRWIASAVLSVFIALLLGGLTWKLMHTTEATPSGFTDYDGFFKGFWVSLGTPATAYLLLAFGLTAIEERGPSWPYRRMFGHLYNFPIQLLLGGAVMGLLLLLIYLWTELFDIIGITTFGKIWREPTIWMPMAGVFAGLGVALARQWTGITQTLRTFCRFMARFTLPIFAAFTVTLLIVLPIQGLKELFGPHNSAASIMSALAVFALLLIYGARQDLGEAPPGWLRWSTALAVLGLPVYVGLATYALWLRVDQYGLTPERYVGLGLVVVLFLHAVLVFVAQAVDLARRNAWLAGAGVVNLASLAVLLAFLLALHVPQFDPAVMSADNQFLRLKQGRVTAKDFDYGYLHFRLGQPGKDALARMKALEDHPDIAAIREGIAVAEGAKSYWEYKSMRRKTEESNRRPGITAPGPGAAPPAEKPETKPGTEPERPASPEPPGQ